MLRKRWPWITLGVLVLLVGVFSFYLDTILRGVIERNMNKRLKGYTVTIRAVSFHPVGFSLDLLDATFFQNEHPDPPVIRMPRLHASVQWRALLHGRLVGDFLVDRPKIHLDFRQAKKEITDPTPLPERGWQDALQEAYPLKINEFRIKDAELTYVDRGPFRPLRLTHLNFQAENIRNIRSREHDYPSTLHLDAVVFDKGNLVLDGNADFLAVPHPGFKADFVLERVDLDYFHPITSRFNVSVRKGTLSSSGTLEYAPKTKMVDLREVTIREVDIAYVHKPETAAAEERTVKKVQQSAKKVSNQPGVLLRVDKVNILKSTVAYVNKAANPEYRIFVSDTDIHVANLSNQHAEGKATATMKGKFMGSGSLKADLAFWPEGKRPAFDLTVQIGGTQLTTMNDLLRAYADFDVVEGQFSFYSEMSVRKGQITGYVKPLFKGMKVYDTEQDREKDFLQKIKEGLIGGIAWLLENRPRDEVATKVSLSGRFDSPTTSTWEAALGLIQNAFFRAILPGFDREARAAARAPSRPTASRSG